MTFGLSIKGKSSALFAEFPEIYEIVLFKFQQIGKKGPRFAKANDFDGPVESISFALKRKTRDYRNLL